MTIINPLKYAAKIIETSSIEPYFDPMRIEGYCKGCPNYAKLWSCPPHGDSMAVHANPVEKFRAYRHVLLVAMPVMVAPGEDAMAIFHRHRRAFAKRLEALKMSSPEPSDYLIAGNCYLCEALECARNLGESCRYPEHMTYSLEAIGYDVCGIAEALLGYRVEWSNQETALKSLTTVGAIFCDCEVALHRMMGTLLKRDLPDSTGAISPTDASIELVPIRHYPEIPERNYVASTVFAIRRVADGQYVGSIELRFGHNANTFYGGNIGYQVAEAFRGNGYAAKAVKLLLPYAQNAELDYLFITCNPDNCASKRTAEIAGFHFDGIVVLPTNNEMYHAGAHEKCIYRLCVPKPSLQISSSLRLVPFDGRFTEAYAWYQDPVVYKNSEGLDAPPNYDYILRMYQYLAKAGELYMIEVSMSEATEATSLKKNDSNRFWIPIGDVCIKAENMPIVIGNPEYRGKGIAKAVMLAALDRAKTLGIQRITNSVIYKWNLASIALHESLGYVRCGEKDNAWLYERIL